MLTIDKANGSYYLTTNIKKVIKRCNKDIKLVKTKQTNSTQYRDDNTQLK